MNKKNKIKKLKAKIKALKTKVKYYHSQVNYANKKYYEDTGKELNWYDFFNNE